MMPRKPVEERFPSEDFVRRAVDESLGMIEREATSEADLACYDPETGVRWIVEIKGGAHPVEDSFRNSLGRLLTYMDTGRKTNYYVLAMPDTEPFARQRASVPPRVRKALNLWWFVVDNDGVVDAISPSDPVGEGIQPIQTPPINAR